MGVAMLVLLLAAAFYHDWKSSKIPNRYTVAGMAIGVVYHALRDGWHGMGMALAGLGAGFGLMLVLYVVRAVGAGDVKLFGAIGALAGPAFVWNGAINSILCAAIVGIVIVAVRGQLAARLRTTGALLFNVVMLRDVKGVVRYKSRAATFPFMYAVVPGMALTALYCPPAM